jgi:hypothetical protein
VLPYASKVQRAGSAQTSAAGGGQDRPGDPPIGGTRPALHETSLHHPVDQTGDPAGAEPDVVGELVHSQPALGGQLELNQDVKFGKRHVLLGDEFCLQLAEDRRLGVQEGPPGAELGGFEAGHYGNILLHSMVDLSNVA